MNARRGARLGVFLVLAAIVWVADLQAAGMQARVARFKRTGAALRVSLEIQDFLNDRFRAVLERGGTLYVRIEAELWEPRSVWDRLVRPASISVARVTREASSRSLALVDPFGEAAAYPSYPRAVTVWADLLPADRVEGAGSYYVHATVTVGTVAENEVAGVSDALFGDQRQSGGLGSLGKFVFQKVLRLADYLDSTSCEVKSARLSGTQLKAVR